MTQVPWTRHLDNFGEGMRASPPPGPGSQTGPRRRRGGRTPTHGWAASGPGRPAQQRVQQGSTTEFHHDQRTSSPHGHKGRPLLDTRRHQRNAVLPSLSASLLHRRRAERTSPQVSVHFDRPVAALNHGFSCVLFCVQRASRRMAASASRRSRSSRHGKASSARGSPGRTSHRCQAHR